MEGLVKKLGAMKMIPGSDGSMGNTVVWKPTSVCGFVAVDRSAAVVLNAAAMPANSCPNGESLIDLLVKEDTVMAPFASALSHGALPCTMWYNDVSANEVKRAPADECLVGTIDEQLTAVLAELDENGGASTKEHTVVFELRSLTPSTLLFAVFVRLERTVEKRPDTPDTLAAIRQSLVLRRPPDSVAKDEVMRALFRGRSVSVISSTPPSQWLAVSDFHVPHHDKEMAECTAKVEAMVAAGESLPSRDAWVPTTLYQTLRTLFHGSSIVALPPLFTGNIRRFAAKLVNADSPVQFVHKRAVATVVDFLGGLARSTKAGDVVHASGALLCGPPGAGKGTIAHAMLSHAGFHDGFRGTASEVNATNIGDCSRRLNDVLRWSESWPGVPVSVFFDDIDAVVQRRGAVDRGGRDVISSVLSALGLSSNGVFLFGTTSRKFAVTDTCIRPLRLSAVLDIGRLCAGDRWTLFEQQWKACRLPADSLDAVFRAAVLSTTQNFTGGLIRQSVVDTAAAATCASPTSVDLRRVALSSVRAVANRFCDADVFLLEPPEPLDPVVANWDVSAERVHGALVGEGATGLVVIDMSDGVTAQVLARNADGMVTTVPLSLVSSDVDIVRRVAVGVASTTSPESLLFLNTARLEILDRSGTGGILRSLSRVLSDSHNQAEHGSCAAIIDVDDLVVPSPVLRRDVLSEIIASMRSCPVVRGASSFLVLVAVTRDAEVASLLKDCLAFHLSGHAWDLAHHGPGIQATDFELSMSSKSESWQVIRARNRVQGPKDMYLLQVQWNGTAVAGNGGNISVGIVKDGVDLSKPYELGCDSGSFGITLPGHIGTTPLSSVSPGDTVGLLLVDGRLMLLRVTPDGVRHVVDIANGVPAVPMGWHVAVGLRGVSHSGLHVAMLRSTPTADLRGCTSVPALAFEVPSNVGAHQHQFHAALLDRRQVIAVATNATPNEWRTAQVSATMEPGAGPDHVYTFEVSLETCATGHVVVGVAPQGVPGLKFLTAGNFVGHGANTGWGYNIADNTKKFDGQSVSVPGKKPSGPWGGQTVVMTVNMDTASTSYNTITYGLRSASGAAVEKTEAVFQNIFAKKGQVYVPAVSVFTAGDVIRLNQPI